MGENRFRIQETFISINGNLIHSHLKMQSFVDLNVKDKAKHL